MVLLPTYKVAYGHSIIWLAYLHFTLIHFKGQGQGHIHADCKYMWNSKRWGTHCYYCQHIWSHIWSSDLHNYILPRTILKVKIKEMYISYANIYKMVKDKETLLLLWNMKLHMDFRSAYLDLTLAHLNVQIDLWNGVAKYFSFVLLDSDLNF